MRVSTKTRLLREYISKFVKSDNYVASTKDLEGFFSDTKWSLKGLNSMFGIPFKERDLVGAIDDEENSSISLIASMDGEFYTVKVCKNPEDCDECRSYWKEREKGEESRYYVYSKRFRSRRKVKFATLREVTFVKAEKNSRMFSFIFKEKTEEVIDMTLSLNISGEAPEEKGYERQRISEEEFYRSLGKLKTLVNDYFFDDD